MAAGQSTVQRVYSRLMVVKAPMPHEASESQTCLWLPWWLTAVACSCKALRLYGFLGFYGFIKRVIRVRRVIEARAGDTVVTLTYSCFAAAFYGCRLFRFQRGSSAQRQEPQRTGSSTVEQGPIGPCTRHTCLTLRYSEPPPQPLKFVSRPLHHTELPS